MEDNLESAAAEMQQPLYPNVLCIGHHNEHRQQSASAEELDHAQDLAYNMITSRITNEVYKQKIFRLFNHQCRECTDASGSQSTITLPPMDAVDSNLSPGSHVARFIFTTSNWIDVTSTNALFADISRKVLLQEISYAAWCGASTIMIRGPQSNVSSTHSGLCRFAHAIREVLSIGANFSILIDMPMVYDPTRSDASKDEHAQAPTNGDDHSETGSGSSPFDPWDTWDYIRGLNKYNSRLSLALAVPQSAPDVVLQSTWFSEPIRLLHIPRTCFVKNDRGFEVLRKSSQDMLLKFMDSKNPPWILLSGIGPLPGYQHMEEGPVNQPSTALTAPDLTNNFNTPPPPTSLPSQQEDPTPAEASQIKPSLFTKRWPNTIHLEYLRTHVQAKLIRHTGEERGSMAFQDFLQDPLQPLRDNLESMTYEVFERDPYKYEAYGHAITRALQDWQTFSKSRSAPGNRVLLAVVGAGRGPLVDECLKAAEQTNADVEVWALEKNPAAFVHIQKRNFTDWGGRVQLVHGDMRNWKGPSYFATGASTSNTNESSAPSTVATYHSSEARVPLSIDILVSELLGSLGDNELSPECLDGVQYLLNPVDGISIPCEYTAHITPVAVPRLHSDLLAKLSFQPDASKDPFQIPYVVWPHTANYISCNDKIGKDERGLDVPTPSVEQLWKFRHPNVADKIDMEDDSHNARFAQASFSCRHRGLCHGLVGYFESILYDPELSPPHKPRQARNDVTVDDSNKHPHPLNGNPIASAGHHTDFLVSDPSKGRFGLSTHAVRKQAVSPKMMSWFPILFPLRTPIYVPDDSELCASMWRRTDGRKVWYEWLVESFGYMENAQRRRTKVRLGASDLHSSENTPSLM
ncbi:MAG: methyltransferase protein [Alyxoria varia]|nr:MAG: methyltransferase protein [Alyxoria varia]